MYRCRGRFFIFWSFWRQFLKLIFGKRKRQSSMAFLMSFWYFFRGWGKTSINRNQNESKRLLVVGWGRTQNSENFFALIRNIRSISLLRKNKAGMFDGIFGNFLRDWTKDKNHQKNAFMKCFKELFDEGRKIL